MKEFKFIIKDKNGLHARPAGALCAKAKTFNSKIDVKCDGKEADAKRLLSLMSLGAVSGKELEFYISGDDENEAYSALLELCEQKLGDGE
ncbi:MAG: HPr family phosphocarrier protein [Clostridia bacterium]|nr:HPr family phosphocarrier protein [Clostridia bacterium]MBP3495712.1 HPr family phosphocarrier protein [Clostridia bacterium]